jgi:DNA-binding transcriptional LysR family regulator
MMSLRHIEVFHAVYTQGSVSAAARALNVSQPSVTKVLRHAEILLGFPLFERSKGRLLPTQDAHTLFYEVSDIQERVYQLRRASANLRNGRAGALQISALPALGLKILPEAVSSFQERHPDVRFELNTAHHGDMLSKLYERETELVIAFEVPSSTPVASDKLGRGELTLLYRESDRPDLPPRVPLAAMLGLPFIDTVRTGPQGRQLGRELIRQDLEFDEVATVRTFFVAAGLVRAGMGFTIADQFTAEASLAPGLSMRPLEPAIGFDVHAVYLESRPLSRAASSFLAHLAADLKRHSLTSSQSAL